MEYSLNQKQIIYYCFEGGIEEIEICIDSRESNKSNLIEKISDNQKI
jgi:hypothetical protein